MKLVLVVLIHFQLIFSTFCLNFRNNACPNLVLYPVAAFSNQCYLNPDVLSNVGDMTKRNGYNLESFEVTTEDGYILSLFHISGKVNATKKFTIFIQHGLVTSSAVWVDIGKRSLAFHLADKGYSVWLGNLRGTTNSTKHKTLSIDDSRYWIYNLDTLTSQDMYTQLKFVFGKTGHKIHYIGHSMGTTLSFMFMSAYPEEANKWLQSASLLAPVVYLNSVIPLELLRGPTLGLINILNFTGTAGLFYQEPLIPQFLVRHCQIHPYVCFSLINAFFGPTKHFRSEELLVFYSYWPKGISTLQAEHYMQFVKSKRFQKFDYGRAGNLKHYNTETPPVYNLTSIKLPVGLFYGESDSLYVKENLERLFEELGSTKKRKYSIPVNPNKPRYSHIDFTMAKNIEEDLYEILLKTLCEFESA